MSMDYWLIEGIGIKADSIEPYLMTDRIVKLFSEQLPDDAELKQMVETGDYSDFDMTDYFYGYPFEHLADVLCFCDDTDTLSYGDDGDGTQYFYYAPSMPWERKEDEPESIAEVHERIIAAVQQIADMTGPDIEDLINDDLYAIGCG